MSPPNVDLPDPFEASSDVPLLVLNGEQFFEFNRPLSNGILYFDSTVATATKPMPAVGMNPMKKARN